MDELVTLAGISWDPAIKGVLVVLVAALILFGSVYLVVATDTGVRLGLLIAGAGLFAWFAIMGLTWTMKPPAIGPKGRLPGWDVVEIVYGDPADAATERAQTLPQPEDLPAADEIIAADPELFAEFTDTATLSELAAVGPEHTDGFDLGGWELVASSDAGEAQSAADAVLVEEGVFENPTDYKVLDAFEIGGKDDLTDDPNPIDRVLHRITTAIELKHPTHYAIIQVQAVVRQEPEPGEAPPLPQLDEDAPVISVIMVRDLGNERVPTALFTAGSTIFLLLFSYSLHRRDQLAMANRAADDDG